MNDSPTRKAFTPWRRKRATSSGVRIPLSVTTVRSGKTSTKRSKVVWMSVSNVPEITVVDADERGAQHERPLQLLAVVDLGQDVHAERLGQARKFLEARVREARHDEEHAVRPQQARFVDLVGVDHEVLAQDRQGASGAGLPEVHVGPLKIPDIGQDREAGGPGPGEGPRQPRRLIVQAHHAPARGGLLAFGDDGGPAFPDAPSDGRRETTRRRRRGGQGLDLGQ